jgi:CspA family cold shock protein
MGRYKTYREPKRRGYGDDNMFSYRPDEAAPNYPSPSLHAASAPVDAVVKWFNAEKGFGFVVLVGGSEAFIHIRQVEAAGHSCLPEGARVKLRIGPGQKGPEVTEVLAIDITTAQSPSKRRTSGPSQVVGEVTECVGTVKLYRVDKGFGFVGRDGGEKDVFVHVTALARAGLSELVEGQRVRMQIGQGQKGIEAQTIELVDK